MREATKAVVDQLQAVAPERRLNPDFLGIVRRGLQVASYRDLLGLPNERWVETTAPLVEAFLHARYFLEMAVKYGRELSAAPMPMPSGWAALLTLYGV